MNVNSKRITVYTVLALLAASVAVGLRTAACFRDLLFESGYYNSKILISSSAYVALFGCILLLSYMFIAEKMSPEPSFSSPKTYAPTGTVAIGLLFIALRLFESRRAADNKISYYVTVLTAYLAILSIVHFFLNAFISDSKTELRGYFSLATVAFLAMYAAFLYFTSGLPLNATNKLIDQLAYLFSALFFLYESRISLGREKWRGYVALGLIASLLTAYSAFPSLIIYFARGRVISNSIEESILTATLFLFITSRLFLTASISENKKSAAVSAMREYAERRSAAVLESMQVHREAFSKQMTIDDLIPTELPSLDEDAPKVSPESLPESIREEDVDAREDGTLGNKEEN